jgi:hypothetical protein
VLNRSVGNLDRSRNIDIRQVRAVHSKQFNDFVSAVTTKLKDLQIRKMMDLNGE